MADTPIPKDDIPVDQTTAQLILTDDYRAAKRNHLLASAVLVLVSAAVIFATGSDGQIAIPFFKEVVMPGWLAVAFTTAAAIYFAAAFLHERLAAKALNSKFVRTTADDEIEDLFMRRIEAEGKWTEKLRTLAKEYPAPAAKQLTELRTVLSDLTTKVSGHKGSALEMALMIDDPITIRPQLAQLVYAMNSEFSSVSGGILYAVNQVEALIETNQDMIHLLEARSEQDEKLKANFLTMSGAIIGPLRRWFDIEGRVCFGLGIAAFAAAAAAIITDLARLSLPHVVGTVIRLVVGA